MRPLWYRRQDKAFSTPQRLDAAGYQALFADTSPSNGEATSAAKPFPSNRKLERALAQAHDARKFEIDMYWKRATYFWAFIGASFVGYAAFFNGDHPHAFAALLMSEVGFVFSYAWFLVNRASKAWQENWENHVELLEDLVTGPIYKLTAKRPDGASDFGTKVENLLTSPLRNSVSKINAIVSLHVCVVWIVLFSVAALSLWRTDNPFSLHEHRIFLRTLAIATCAIGVSVTVFLFHWKGKTHTESHTPVVELRPVRISEE
jgi:hypothetical protein